MDCSGISSAGTYYGARINMRSAQKQLNAVTQQMDGLKGKTYSAIYDQARMLLGYENQVSILGGHLNENRLIDFKLQRIEGALSTIKDTAQKLQSAFLYARSSCNERNVDLRAHANEALHQLITDLNSTNEEGSYIFSGSRFNIKPVEMSFMPLPQLGAGPCTLYYQGDHLLPQQNIDIGRSLTYGVTADHPAFEQLMRAYNLLAHAPDQNIDPLPYWDEAFALLNKGFEDLVEVSSQVAQTRKCIDDANSNLEDFKNIAEDHIADLIKSDPAEAITRWTALQVQLQSTLMVMQRLHQTSLVNMMS